MAVVIGLSVIDNCESPPLVGVSSSVEGTPVGVETTFVVGRFESPVLSAVASLDDCVKSIAGVTLDVKVDDIDVVPAVKTVTCVTFTGRYFRIKKPLGPGLGKLLEHKHLLLVETTL